MPFNVSGAEYARFTPPCRRERCGNHRPARSRHRPQRSLRRRGLLFIMAPVIGASGTLGLLALLIAAFGAGWGFARAQPRLYRAPLTATRWAFLVSAAGWLLALVAWYGGQAWPSLLPGVMFGSAGRLSPGALPRGGRHCRVAASAAPRR